MCISLHHSKVGLIRTDSTGGGCVLWFILVFKSFFRSTVLRHSQLPPCFLGFTITDEGGKKKCMQQMARCALNVFIFVFVFCMRMCHMHRRVSVCFCSQYTAGCVFLCVADREKERLKCDSCETVSVSLGKSGSSWITVSCVYSCGTHTHTHTYRH